MATLTAVNRLCCVTNTKEPENWKSLKRRLAKKSEFHFTTGICKLPKESKKWHFFFFSYRFSPYKLGYSCFHKPNRLYYLLLSLDLENWKSLDLMLAVSKQNKSSEARGKPPKDCQRTKEVMRNDTKDYFFVCCMYSPLYLCFLFSRWWCSVQQKCATEPLWNALLLWAVLKLLTLRSAVESFCGKICSKCRQL